MKPEYSLEENQIIDKIESYADYANDWIIHKHSFSFEKYVEMIEYLKHINKILNIDDNIIKYSKYCLDTFERLDIFKQYVRYVKLQKLDKRYERRLKLQKLKKQSNMNETKRT